MSELPEGISAAEPATPRDSASGVVVRRGPEGGTQVLLGLRSRKARFMPGHLAFLGGVLDPADQVEGGAEGETCAALTRCVSREIEEEAGLAIPAADWIAAGSRVTPPMSSLRFDNRFFVAAAPAAWQVPQTLPSPEEIEHLEFMDPLQVLDDWTAGRTKIAPPVMPLLSGVAEHGGRPVAELATRLEEINRIEQRAPRIEFCPDVWMVPVRTATLPPATHTNVWMPGVGRFVVIDPGCSDPDEQAMLLEVIERRRANGATPLAVLLTHGHVDHMAGARAIARALAVPLRAHQEVLDGLTAGHGDPALQPVADGEIFDLEGLTLVARLTPGHAPGHLVFHIPERGAAVAGDLLSGISTILIDPVTGDMGAYLESLELLRQLECRTLFPGHGPAVPGKAPARLIRHRLDREALIAQQLSAEAIDLATLAQVAYADTPQALAMPAVLIERQALAHLLLLERQGRARRADAEGRAWVEQTTPGEIERILRDELQPLHFELADESHKHAGHAGATSGGGHYRVKVVSAAFEGLPLIERHRRINNALRSLFGTRIHALALRTLSPSEWKPR